MVIGSNSLLGAGSGPEHRGVVENHPGHRLSGLINLLFNPGEETGGLPGSKVYKVFPEQGLAKPVFKLGQGYFIPVFITCFGIYVFLKINPEKF